MHRGGIMERVSRRIYHNDPKFKPKTIKGKTRWQHDNSKWPLNFGWMEKDKSIWRRLNNPKDRSFHHMITILQHLWEKRLDLFESKFIAERINAGLYNTHKYDDEGKERRWPFVMCAPLDYDYLEARDLDQRKISYCLNALVKCGFLRSFRRIGRNGPVNYAIGYYIVTSHAPYGRAYPFLKSNPACQKALINFKFREKM